MLPENVWDKAIEALDEAADPPPSTMSSGFTGQPMDGCGYVYAQVGWLAGDGSSYGLSLPDHLYHNEVALRPLYICLGQKRGQSAHPPGESE